MAQSFTRSIRFEGILNFRDLGGYSTLSGRLVKRRWIFRSGELRFMTDHDFARLTGELKIRSVIDLRNPVAGQAYPEVIRIARSGVRYHGLPLITGQDRQKEKEDYPKYHDMGEVYLYRISHQRYSRHIVEALELIADPENQPLLFHCAAGKDRSGVLAAILLSVLGVADEDVVTDYILSAYAMPDMRRRLENDPVTADAAGGLPEYHWEAEPDSMYLVLAGLRQKYGSVSEYVKSSGASASLIERLQNTLLV